MLTNEQRAEQIIKKYAFDFEKIPKNEIIDLIQNEIESYQDGSSEYIRVLCGYLFCIGDVSDAFLLEKAKYSINMDVGCMIDGNWIDALKHDNPFLKKDLIDEFIEYYKNFQAGDE